jgi:2-amino-4-hydroxy-6-hydroxymethyldihydropteridine diphosphokinase
MTEKHKVVVAIGSNSHQEENLQKAKTLIEQRFTEAEFSPTLWTKPIGMDSDMFLNALAVFTTAHDIERTTEELKEIEAECGNTEKKREEGIVSMDLDILLFDKEKRHNDDWSRPYIKKLLEFIVGADAFLLPYRGGRERLDAPHKESRL